MLVVHACAMALPRSLPSSDIAIVMLVGPSALSIGIPGSVHPSESSGSCCPPMCASAARHTHSTPGTPTVCDRDLDVWVRDVGLNAFARIWVFAIGPGTLFTHEHARNATKNKKEIVGGCTAVCSEYETCVNGVSKPKGRRFSDVFADFGAGLEIRSRNPTQAVFRTNDVEHRHCTGPDRFGLGEQL